MTQGFTVAARPVAGSAAGGQDGVAAPLTVLVLTRNFPPLRGGMERLIHALVGELAQRCPVAMVGPAGCARFVAPAVQVKEVPIRPLWRFFLASTRAGLRLLWQQRPGVILCGSGLMAPLGWLLSRLGRVPFVCYLHGLDIVADHPVYRRVFVPLIRRCDLAVCNSRHTAALARAVGLAEERIAVVHPGVQDAGSPDPARCEAFRARHGLGSATLLSVGRLTRRKGLLEFLQLAMPALVRACPDIRLVVVGAEARDALKGQGAGLMAELDEAVKALGLGEHVRLLGDLSDDELAVAYAVSQVLAFPVLELPGDVEGFGMVALEAAAHGVPTVAFAVGGVPDAVDEQRSGTLVSPGDYPALVQALLDYLPAGASTAQRCREFAAGFHWSTRGEALFQLLSRVARRSGPSGNAAAPR